MHKHFKETNMSLKNERPADLYGLMDGFIQAHKLSRTEVAGFVGQLGELLYGGTARDIDAERTAEAAQMAEEGRADTAIAKRNGAGLELRDRAMDLNSLLTSYAQLEELPIPTTEEPQVEPEFLAEQVS